MSSSSSQLERDGNVINAKTVDEMKAMIRNGRVDRIKGPYGNIRDIDSGNITALMKQCLDRRIETSRFLLEECFPPADPNLTNDKGWTALHYSVSNIC